VQRRLLPLAMLTLLVGCRPPANRHQPHPGSPSLPKAAAVRAPLEVTSEVRNVVAADTGFGFSLFAELRKETPGANVFVSPASVALALHMAYNGAVRETKEAMAKVLGLEGVSRVQLNQTNAALMADLKGADPDVQMSIANSVWIRQPYPFSETFLGVCSRYYGAKATELDFEKPDAVGTINRWVQEATGGKIDGIVDQSIRHQLITLILISATYVDASWSEPFEKDDDQPGKFTLLDGSQKDVVMMNRAATLGYFDGDGFQAACLPYGSGRFGFYILLPDRESSLAALCKHLTVDEWEACLRGMADRDLTLSLPRFRVECAFDLKPSLKALGMGIAFDEARAEFDDLVPEPRQIWIEQTRHKTLMEVSEKGTKVAAATQVAFTEGTAAEGPLALTVDRPFVCVIRDDHTGAILFMGAIVDPEPL
jgi:serine protease inhibitor